MIATTPLIIGAGPSGLAAALFLHERGTCARVIDAAAEISPWSKALGVNPRTLNLLEPSGVTAAIIAEGTAVERVHISRAGRPVATIPLDYAAVGARWPLTILPQARTEMLLHEALARRGVKVERGVRLTDVVQSGGIVGADLALPDGTVDTARAPIMLAADGAHSVVRKALGVSFPGDTLGETWTLMDLELDGPIPDGINIDLQPTSLLVAFPISARRWRLIAIGGGIGAGLPNGWSKGTNFWTSEFRVSHRVADRMSIGSVALAGDAAHIHSPIGARGMNLGIEDAWVWAACAADALAGRPERLSDYGRLRSKVDASVVRRVQRVTMRFRQPALPPI
jgi:2-polyprenyl-6-methoxyphenol hydroxylase-like FAD-dependent oxidoreductase